MTMDRPKPSESGEAWASGDAAGGWQRGAAARGRALGPLTELMFDLAGVTVGSHVLDLGAGTGDQTLMAARRIGPGSMVLATDISASMLALT
jgi:trans-aconitate methyltransferase